MGSAIFRKLLKENYTNLLVRTRSELDLLNQSATQRFLANERPEVVVIAAALVGGIKANSERPADFIAQNLGIQQNLIWGSHEHGVEKLLFLGSSCVYPRETFQPIPETALLSGAPEPTNAPYAIAKIAGMKMCESISKQFGRNYFSLMPPNVFGDGDNFDPVSSHVMAAMILRFHNALPDKSVTCWGSGSPKREFLDADELADACLHFLNLESVPSIINIGRGTSITIRDLAEMVQRVVGHKGKIEWDTTKPDGFPEKTNDVSLASSLGWQATGDLEQQIGRAYRWMLENVDYSRYA